MIVDQTGSRVEGTTRPYEEGQTLELTCLVHGGKNLENACIKDGRLATAAWRGVVAGRGSHRGSKGPPGAAWLLRFPTDPHLM